MPKFKFPFKKNDENLEMIMNSPYFELSNESSEAFKEKVASLSEEEKHQCSKLLHKKDLVAFDKKQNSLCFIVIGFICGIIGVLFIFLSMKKKLNKYIGFDYGSLQFIFMIIMFTITAFCLIFGFIRFFLAISSRRDCKKKINIINASK